MARHKNNGRPQTSCASATEVFVHWQKLSTEERSKALCFSDSELVTLIMQALQHIQQQHEACLAAGFALTSDVGGDPFKNSPLLGDILCISAYRHTALDISGRVETSFVLRIKDSFLARDDLLGQLRSVLPDFLEPRSKSRRFPLPRQRWKQLWDCMPTTFHALERQLAMTMEQAFWAMDVASRAKWAESASVQPSVSPDVAEESWMIEPVPNPTVSKAKRKQARKKCKNHGNTEVPASAQQELQNNCQDVPTICEPDPAMQDEQCPPCSEAVHIETHGQSCTLADDAYALCKANGTNMDKSESADCAIPFAESLDDQALIKVERHYSDASTMCDAHSDAAGLLAEDSEEQNSDSAHYEVPASESSDYQASITVERRCSDASTMCDVHSDTARLLAGDSEEQNSDVSATCDLGSDTAFLGEPAFILPGAPVTSSLSADQLFALIPDHATPKLAAGPPGLDAPLGFDAPPGLPAPWPPVLPDPGPDPTWPQHESLLQHATMLASAGLPGIDPHGLPLHSELCASQGLPLQPEPCAHHPCPSFLQQLPIAQQLGLSETSGLPGPTHRFCGWCGHQHQHSTTRFCTRCGYKVGG